MMTSGSDLARPARPRRLLQAGGRDDRAAPAAEQRPHAVQDGRLVVDAQHGRCRRAAAPAVGAASALRRHGRQRRRDRDLDARTPSPCRRCDFRRDRVVEHARDALDDGQAEARARARRARPGRGAGTRGRRPSAWMAGCRGRYPTPRRAACPRSRRQPTSTRPCGVYLMALETRFCSRRRSSRRSERTVSEQGTKASSRPFSRATGSNSSRSWFEDVVDAEARQLRLHRPGVEARDVEQRGEDLLDRLQRGVDVLGERRRRPPMRSRSTSDVA